MHPITVFVGAAVLAAQPVVLTWEGALERARSSSPAVIAARMRIEEARARVVVRNNPAVEVEAGRRRGTSEYSVEIGQDVDLPARRRARVDAVRAAVTREEQLALDAEREASREIATAFLRAIEWRERADAAASSKHLVDEALRIATRRYAAGDVAQLEVNLARTSAARAETEVRAANASLLAQLTRLQVLAGIAETVSVAGSLREGPPLPASNLVAQASQRADVRALDAEIAEAEADQRLAQTLRWPDFGLRASYGKEEGDRIVRGGVGVTLPFFNRGQEATAVASARLARLRAERAALARTIDAEVHGAVAMAGALRAAAAEYERTVLPLLDENERLALESYDVGQIGLADLLVVQREALDARRSLIDQLIETRLAEVELRAIAGVWK